VEVPEEMTANPKKETVPSITSEAVASTNEEAPTKVDQIRGLLFGAQREEYDRRFTRLEELLFTSVSDLSGDMTSKVGAQKEDFDRRLSRLEESLLKNITEANDKFTSRLNTQREEYEKKLARLEELLVENIATLDDEKLDRATLAKLLQQILQFSQKLKINEEKKD
jgi:hypothetical protein